MNKASIRILVVDDFAPTLEATRRVLQAEGYEVSTAGGGEEGLRKVREERPELVLLDREMPDLNGLEVCRRIKADPTLAATLVIMASAAKVTESALAEGLESGADGYLTRPIGNRELKARVEAYARIAALTRERMALQTEAVQRAAEAESLVQELDRARAAALNLMEDALLAKRKLEESAEALRESEQRYRQVVDTQEDAICRWTPDTTLTFANTRYLELFGLSEEHYFRKKWIDHVPASARALVEERVRKLIADCVSMSYEHEVRRADGAIRFFHWTDTPILDREGRCQEVQSIGRDVTELRATEALAQRRLNAMEHSPASIVITNREGLIEYVNPKFTQVTGYTLEEVRGQNPRVLKSGETLAAEYKAMWDVLSSGQDWHGEFHNRRKDGTLFWELASISPLRDNSGNITHFVAVKEDITARKEAEQRLANFSQRALSLLQLPVAAEKLDESAFMQHVMEECERLTGSSVSFIHLVNDDQTTIELVTWSRNTLAHYCTAAFNRHYPISEAGIWAEAFRQRKPVVFNDYATAPQRRGLPAGHAELKRMVSLPVIEGERVRMLVGVGNKPELYTDMDVETIQLMANEAWRITEHRRAERALRLSEKLLEETGTAGGVGGWELDLRTQELRWTRMTRRIHEVPNGYVPTLEEGIKFYDPEGRAALVEAIEEAQSTGRPWDLELPFTTYTGRKIWVRAVGQARFENGQAVKLLGAFQDITERRAADAERARLSQHLAQAQKMESIGLLAGGIAHEFNNKLQAILGFTEMAAMSCEPGSPIIQDLQEIQKAARHSSDLTRQLLAYASKQMVMPRVVDLVEVVSRLVRMVQRLLGENIQMIWETPDSLWPVRMDPTQIDQIVTNLALNARDAMDGKGELRMEARNCTLAEDDPLKPVERVAGDYVCLSVSDSGIGMAPEVKVRIFEPFFTTKPQGKGTGLGLSTVYGIVRQNGGFLHVESTPGKGSTFMVFLPRDRSAQAVEAEVPPATDPRGNESILLVEDEAAILRLSQASLKQLGYQVLSSTDPAEAVRLARQHSGPLHLLVTDVMMPGLNGKQVYEQVQVIHPGIRLLYMSGHASEVLGKQGVSSDVSHLLVKPFTLSALAHKVRAVLDEEPAHSRGAG